MNKKELYQQKLEAKLEKWSADIEKLKAKAKDLNAESQIKYKKEIEEMQYLLKATRAKLDDLKNTSKGAWDDIKSGLDTSKESLKNAITSAYSRFK
ncbi:MAG: coiled coil domain-containing protein [Myxococcota bacterium]